MSYPHTSADCGEHHDLIRDFGDTRPAITVLCGSTRFGEAFRDANLRLTLAGEIVLSIGCDMKSDAALFDGLEPAALDAIKANLDRLHKRKIDLADRVFILNVDGYIGDSTRSEIEYARMVGKPIDYLVDPTGSSLSLPLLPGEVRDRG
jgi:hypothetical protein